MTAARPPGSKACSSAPRARAPFPALVLLHGCTGLRTATGAIQGKLRFWAEHLRDLGYVALLVDSFTTRGIDEVCTGRHLLSPVRDRADDARGALRYLQGRPRRAGGPDRASRLVQRGGGHAQRALRPRARAERDFRAAVAFYPNCTRNYPGGPDFRPYAPLYILMGALDDWTPAAPCMALVERARAAGAPIAIKVYPGAHHSFDAPATPRPLPARGEEPQQGRRRLRGDRGHRSRRAGRRDRGGYAVPRVAAGSRPRPARCSPPDAVAASGAVSRGRTPPWRAPRCGGRWRATPWPPARARSGRGSRPWTWRCGSRRPAIRPRPRPGPGRRRRRG